MAKTEIVTTTEAMRVLGVTRSEFRGQIRRGEIAPVERTTPNGRMKFALDDVKRLKQRMQTEFAGRPAGK